MKQDRIVEIPTLQTSQLILRPLIPTDAIILHSIYQTEGVLKYFPNPDPLPLEKVVRFIAFQQSHWEKYGYGNWGILPMDQQKIIGWAGLQYVPELDETEIGFLLDRPFWGRGFATAAARASLRYGFEQHHLDHLIALATPDNLASWRVLEKCGMVFVETISLWGIQLLRHRIDNQRLVKIPGD